jgi:hypothetical protein
MTSGSTTTDKDFKVKNGLSVAGDATFGSNVILGTTPLAFDKTTNRLQVYVNNAWASIATLDDLKGNLSFMDIGLSIDYNGQPTYIVQANGVVINGDSKFVDAGTPIPYSNIDYIFDAGVI